MQWYCSPCLHLKMFLDVGVYKKKKKESGVWQWHRASTKARYGNGHPTKLVLNDNYRRTVGWHQIKGLSMN